MRIRDSTFSPLVLWRRLPCAGRGCATGGTLSASARGKTHWGFQNKKEKKRIHFICVNMSCRCRDPSELGLLTSATVCLRCGGGGGGGQVINKYYIGKASKNKYFFFNLLVQDTQGVILPDDPLDPNTEWTCQVRQIHAHQFPIKRCNKLFVFPDLRLSHQRRIGGQAGGLLFGEDVGHSLSRA